MKRTALITLLAIASMLAQSLGAAPAAAADAPLVFAKYYAWFDQNTWGNGKLSDQPAQPYLSSDRKAIERQVDQAKAAGIDGFQLNWWGPDNPTDTNLQTLLAVAKAKGFKVSVDFDLNSPFMTSRDDVVQALGYLDRYYGDPAWFRYDGQPVISFYGLRKYDVATWGAIRGQVGGNALWIGEGDQFGYLNVFDGIHPYSVAWSPNPASQLASYAARTRTYPNKLWVATVMPGYDDTRLGRGAAGFAVDRASGAYYGKLWLGAIATQPAFVTITSWNEWMEGSQIEPSSSYGDLYLRLTREMSELFKGSGYQARPVAPVAPPAPARPTSSGTSAFYTEAGGGKGGFRIDDGGGVSLLASFRALGGVDALGFPASQRFEKDGFTYQVAQGAVLQWRPELGRAVLANSFEWFTAAGKDDWLSETAGMPKPIADDGSNGSWERAKATRLAWLTDDAIKQQYLAAGSLERAIELYGLPTSKPERRGPFVVQRFQRIAFQHWVENVQGMPPAGSVVRVLGGDLLKQAGLVPSGAAQPTAS
jgi:hypothetical protein